MKYLVLGFISLFFLSVNVKADNHQIDALSWLKKMEAASHQLTYSGTFVYQHGTNVETSKITHFVDDAGVHEKLDMLDGPPRVTIRLNDEVYCYLPDHKTVRVEKRNTRKFFPALLPKEIDRIAESYTIKLGGIERVAGYECRAVVLEPKDDLRYAHKLCADVTNALLVKASLINRKNEVLNQFAFTHLTVGGHIDKSQFKPKALWSKHTWQTDKSVVLDANNHETGWLIKHPPLGFIKTKEMKRVMPGKTVPVTHLIYSDGLATVSVFIEPLAGIAHPMQGLSSQEQVNIYAKSSKDHQITAIGEVPVATVVKFANSAINTGK